jgi:hypothetical protein
MPDFGLFTVDADARRVRGILIPWEEMSRTSQTGNRPMKFKPGGVTVPRDASVVGLNLEHDRFSPIGRLASAEPVTEGLYAEFAIADTDEGDAWLADHGELVRLSPELKNIRVSGDYGAASLTGAAVVADGAWASAGLFAVGDVTEDDQDDDDDDQDDDDAAGTPAETDVPAEGPPAEPGDDTEREDAVPDATVPTTMLGGRARRADVPSLTRNGFFAALRTARRDGNQAVLQPYLDDAENVGLFALNNITYDDANGLAADAAIPHTWLGELAGGARFQRTVVPLLSPGVLRSLVATGWVWNVRPSMGLWAGNKTAIPSNNPTVTPKDFTAQRFAGGHDLAREYYDFNVTEVIDSYIESMVDSYYVLSDDFALDQLVAGATAVVNTSTTVSGQLAQMARAVLAARVAPTFALVAPDVFDAFTDVISSESSAYFSPTINLADGDLKGIPLIPDDRLAAGQAVVGSKSAATAWELPGVPIRVSAPDLVLGGVDNALFGYIAVGVTYPAGLVKSTITITAADAPAVASSKSSK